MGLALAILIVLRFYGAFPALNQVHLAYSRFNDGKINRQAAFFQFILNILHFCIALACTVNLFCCIHQHTGSCQQIVLLLLGRLALQPRDYFDGDDRGQQTDLSLQHRGQVNHVHIHRLLLSLKPRHAGFVHQLVEINASLDAAQQSVGGILPERAGIIRFLFRLTGIGTVSGNPDKIHLVHIDVVGLVSVMRNVQTDALSTQLFQLSNVGRNFTAYILRLYAARLNVQHEEVRIGSGDAFCKEPSFLDGSFLIVKQTIGVSAIGNGFTQSLAIATDKLRKLLEQDGAFFTHSGKYAGRTQFDFSGAQRTLQKVCADPLKRRALSKALRNRISSRYSEVIHAYNDFPNCFYLIHSMPNNREHNGGLILHRGERDGRPYLSYDFHT